MPKESVTSLKQQNQDLKDTVDAAVREGLVLKQLLRLVIAIIMLQMMKQCLVVYNI